MKVKPFRIFNSAGVRIGRAYTKQEQAVEALRLLDDGGHVDRLYYGVVAAKNTPRGSVMVLDNMGMPRHMGNVETSLGNPNPSPFN